MDKEGEAGEEEDAPRAGRRATTRQRISSDEEEDAAPGEEDSNPSVSEADVKNGDLSKCRFPEDSVIDPGYVPALEGLACDRCTQKSKENCQPLWHKNRSKVTVRCAGCERDKNRCSFANLELGLVEPPVLFKTETGDAKRKSHTLSKHLSLAKNNPEHMTKSVAFQGLINEGYIAVLSDGSNQVIEVLKDPKQSLSSSSKGKGRVKTQKTPRIAKRLQDSPGGNRESAVAHCDDEMAHLTNKAGPSRIHTSRIHREVIEFVDLQGISDQLDDSALTATEAMNTLSDLDALMAR